MKVTKSQLQQLIREEYVKVLLESKGYRPSPRQVRDLVENLDEGFFDALGAAFKSGKQAYMAARSEDQEVKNDAAKTKTLRQIKEEVVAIRMKAKDKLKRNGYVGDDNDTGVLGVELFEKAVRDIVSEIGERPDNVSFSLPSEKNVRAGGGTYR